MEAPQRAFQNENERNASISLSNRGREERIIRSSTAPSTYTHVLIYFRNNMICRPNLCIPCMFVCLWREREEEKEPDLIVNLSFTQKSFPPPFTQIPPTPTPLPIIQMRFKCIFFETRRLYLNVNHILFTHRKNATILSYDI